MVNEKVRKIRDKFPLAVFSQKKRPVDKFIFIKFKFRRIIINRIFYIIRFHKILYFLAGKKLKKLSGKCKSIEDYLNLLESFRYSIFNRTLHVLLLPMQRKSEITRFCKILVKNRPKTVLEIGTAFGGTLFLLTRFSTPKALILSIDLRGKKKISRGTLYHSFAIDKQKIIYLGGRNSHETSTLLELKKRLKNRQIDLLFIDGDHSYEGVKKDFEMYSPLVKKNGIIAFHDIVFTPDRSPDKEVNKFWNEIKENYEYEELVDDWNQEGGGIGLIKIK